MKILHLNHVSCTCFFLIRLIIFSCEDGLEDLRNFYGGDISTAVFDIVEGFPSKGVCICYDMRVGKKKSLTIFFPLIFCCFSGSIFVEFVLKQLNRGGMATSFFNLTTIEAQEMVNCISKTVSVYFVSSISDIWKL